MNFFNIYTIINELSNLFPEAVWTISNRPELGILSTNYAFIQAKKEQGKKQTSPQEFAASFTKLISDKIENSDLKNLVECANTGPFVNIKLTAKGVKKMATFLVKPKLLPDNAKAVMLEYVSPNVAKPLHVGHVRNANIGESLFRVFSLKYADIITDNHWGDWGVQFGILLWAWQKFVELKTFSVVINDAKQIVNLDDYQKDPIDTLVKLYVWGNQQKETTQNWEEIVRNEFLLLEQKEPERFKLWQKFVEVSQKEIAKDLKSLNVTPHQLNQGESFYENDMKKLEDFLNSKNIWKADGKARYFDFSQMLSTWENPTEEVVKILKKVSGGAENSENSEKDNSEKSKTENPKSSEAQKTGRGYLISSQGYTTYLFRDVATRWQWVRDFKRNLMITLTDHSQTHNFDQAFLILSYLNSLPDFEEFVGKDVAKNLQLPNLVHIPYGYLTLPEGKMSTRKGTFLTAKTLIKTIEESAAKTLLSKNLEADKQPGFVELTQKLAISALKWFDLSKDYVHDVVLDVPKILQFEGNTGVYQLYTLARFRSIISKNKEFLENTSQNTLQNTSQDWNLEDYLEDYFFPELLNNTEFLILQKMATAPIILELVVSTYKPHHICTYLYELASMANSWYAIYNVSTETSLKRKQTLLVFCLLLADHIACYLKLLAIDPVEVI